MLQRSNVAPSRRNIPPTGLETQRDVRATPAFLHQYNPPLPPVLRSASDAAAADALPELLHEAMRRPLSQSEAAKSGTAGLPAGPADNSLAEKPR